jgi:acylphosphatase
MKKAVRVYVFGTVQEVFFRAFVKEQADKLGIKGYVRNKDDNSVEAWFEGNAKEVNKMIEICKKGPEHAVIERLDVVDEKFQGMKNFKIIRF